MNPDNAATGNKLSILLEAPLDHGHPPHHPDHPGSGVHTAVKLPVESRDVNIDGHEHREQEKNGGDCQGLAITVQRKQDVQKGQTRHQHQHGQSERQQVDYQETDDYFDHGDAWSADRLNLGIHGWRLDDTQRLSSPTAAGSGRCQRMQRPKNPGHRNYNAGRQFGAVSGSTFSHHMQIPGARIRRRSHAMPERRLPGNGSKPCSSQACLATKR